MTLLLFDIDGTLLQVNGTTRTAIEHSMTEVTGCPISTEGVAFSGRTDPAIFRDILEANDVAPNDGLLQTVLDAYVETALNTIRPEDVKILPGASALLSSLKTREDSHLGLVTGNVKPVAYHKLKMVGLTDYFSVGAFGSDHSNRSKLPALALHRASVYTGHSFQMTQTLVIGDTQPDIQCARDAGARSIAVCTGRHTYEELARHTPDLLLETLPAYDTFEKQVFGV